MGGKRPLTVEDLGTIGHDYKASTLYEHYSVEWEKEQKKAKAKGKKPSFIMAMVRATGLCYWITGILLILDHILILDIDQFHVILGLFFMLFTASYYFSVLF